MTEHERTRELAAIAIDFELDASERAELDAHLEACDPCRSFVAALSGDSATLAALPRIDAPERVRRAVLAGTPGRSPGSARPLAAAVIVLVLTLVPLGTGVLMFGGFGGFAPGGGPGSGPGGPMVTPGTAATGAPTMVPATAAPAVPTASPAPSPSPSPRPSSSPSPSPAASPGAS